MPFILHRGWLRSWADRRRRGRLSRDGLGWQELALARAAVAWGPPLVALHRPEELPLQRPGVGLLDPQPPPELDRGDPLRRRRDQPDGQEPARERQLGAGEDRAGRGRRLVPARAALDLRPGVEPGSLATAADRADEALGPAQLLHRRPAPRSGAVGRLELRLAQPAHPRRQLACHAMPPVRSNLRGNLVRSHCRSKVAGLNDPDGGGEVDAHGRLRGARSQLVAAHLAFDPAWHPPASAARDPLLQDFVQYRLMQGALASRGEGPRTRAACAVRLAPRAGTRAGPGPRRPAAPPRASARAPRSAPAAGPRTPAGPARGSCCAAPPALPAAASSARPARPRPPTARGTGPPAPPRVPRPGRRSSSPAGTAARRRRSLPAGTRPPAPGRRPPCGAGPSRRGRSCSGRSRRPAAARAAA